ncbi:GAF domain-containing protein [Mesorhizobium yinganensis]|uniref:GAF domain-containing protein n=1 Tax=Mesorhizobium yinganensis TaxID=3157707 RepID=UPI0032B8025E
MGQTDLEIGDRIASLIQELSEAREQQVLVAVENTRLVDELQQRDREVKEAREQQAATSEVLKAISSSAFDLGAVLQTLVKAASDLCHAPMGCIYLRDGDLFRPAMQVGWTDEFFELMSQNPMGPGRGSVTSRVAMTGLVEHIPDALADPEYTFAGAVTVGAFRTVLGVPLLRDTRVIGVFVLARPAVRPFSKRETELVESFSHQAVIALENVRLFDAVQERNREVTEALERQTATGAILRVIASSPTDIQPVLRVVAESAARFCDTRDAVIMLVEDGKLAIKAHYGPIPLNLSPMPMTRDWVTGRAFTDRQTVHIHDLLAEGEDFPLGQRFAEQAGHRTIAATPLLRNEEAIGALVIRRSEVRPFSDKQIELMRTFADQAAIAIENVRLFDEVRARTAELSEALRHQTATADVLKVISRSAFDLQQVFQALVESAVRLCGADLGAITLRDGDVLRYKASYGSTPELRAYEQSHPHPLGRGTFQGRAAVEGVTIHVPDVLQDWEYERQEAAAMGGFKAALSVPLRRGAEVVGVFGLARRTVGPFAPRQIELVETFADQAVIAIENARLFEEVQARTAELTESLAQQIATADVLKVISRSTFDLPTVLDTLVASAVRLCRADKGCLERLLDTGFQYAAIHGFPPDFRRYADAHPTERNRGSAVGRAAEERRIIHIPDVRADPDYTYGGVARAGVMRTVLAVPLLREADLVGAFAMIREDVRPFSDKEIELVKTFADQAVIAIENVRLFDELQARNREITEALERQTATGAILRVIAQSPTVIQPVLEAVAESAARLCDAYDATIYLLRDEWLAVGAHHGPIPIDTKGLPIRRDVVTGRAMLDREAIHVHDLTVAGDEFALGREMARRLGFRTILATPLLREDEAIGALMIRRIEPRPFVDNQIELLKTFADQAVIAISNVRLFEEVQARTAELTEALAHQTATSDVLKAISRSAFDLRTVLEALSRSAADVCNADKSLIFLREGDDYQPHATFGIRREFLDFLKANPRRKGQRSLVPRVIESAAVEHIPDILVDANYEFAGASQFSGHRAMLGVPLLRDGQVEGVFVLSRDEPGPFTHRQVELLETFADQAVIAVENARLFQAVQHRTNELSRSLDDLRKAQDRLIQTEKLASLGQLTAGIAHEIKNPLNFVNNFSSLSGELIEELQQVLYGAALDGKMREEVDELAGLLKSNLDKVVQHGRRADSIVKNMLMHSREGSGEHRPTSVNAVVEESLNLAYHGARAEGKGFNITLERDFDAAAGDVDLFPQEMTRVLLNLISNGFYATVKRGQQANGVYDPVLAACTRSLGDSVEITIRDNGTGISPEVREKMFNPFFTTKPAGEGTGLGLSLSHDIIVKQHAGTIDVDSRPGEYTEFRIVLPRKAASLGTSGGDA